MPIHPDDPPRPLFGLPRIASSKDDYAALFEAVPSPANGMCFCTGSLGVAATNDLVDIARSFAPRIHFVHLRATRREPDGSFYEAVPPRPRPQDAGRSVQDDQSRLFGDRAAERAGGIARSDSGAVGLSMVGSSRVHP